MFKKIYNLIQMLIMLYTFTIALFGLGQLAVELVKELKHWIHFRIYKILTSSKK